MTDEMIGLLTEIRDAITAQTAALNASMAKESGVIEVTDADLDGQHGDPKIRMRVRDWAGPDMKGKLASQCPPEFLDEYAKILDWAAGKDAKSDDVDKRKYAPLVRKDAARCRGWARRLREGGGATVLTTPAWAADKDTGGW